MHSEIVSLRDVLSVIRNSRMEARMTIQDVDEPGYKRAMDRELQTKLGVGIAQKIQPSTPTFSRAPEGLVERSIETWVLTRDQHDAIVMVLMKLAEHMKTFSVILPVYGDQDVAPLVTKGR